jgi:hypothetical protein
VPREARDKRERRNVIRLNFNLFSPVPLVPPLSHDRLFHSLPALPVY